MTISATPSAATYNSDPQVQKLNAEIKDWSNCPTTPPAEKKQIVSKLQSQLDGTVAALEHSDQMKAEQSPSSGLDIRA